MHKQNKMPLQERKKKGLLKSLNVADSQKKKSQSKKWPLDQEVLGTVGSLLNQ